MFRRFQESEITVLRPAGERFRQRSNRSTRWDAMSRRSFLLLDPGTLSREKESKFTQKNAS